MDYLPIFVDIRDRLVVVVGGGVVAARKVEHLLKAHARVRVVAPTLGAELTLFRDAGRIEYRPLLFSAAQLDGAQLVVAATDDEQINDSVALAARERGVWVNVVDDAARSAFIFPAIVDRAPLIVAIGTEGSSPTLARRVRMQIEALLPARLGELAAYAGCWREPVQRALPALGQRLRFWDSFFSGPVATRLLAGDARGADDSMRGDIDNARTASAERKGEVYLIGVGPGDPDLLTLRAQQLLQQADVLLHDRLVPEAILGRARRDAERVNVGKVPGAHEVTQAFINQLLIDYAGRGLRVARVKGGDPFIFGRGGEELDVLRKAGIPVIVVPGITAGLGAAASSGIPLTQRGLSQSVTFVTATGAQGVDLNWAALAQPGQTVVFYMSSAQVQLIVDRLAGNGLSLAHPAALIERATWPDQRVIKTTLGELAQVAQAAQLKSPTLLIVGEVTALAQTDALAPATPGAGAQAGARA
ncbi:MAG TPA: siroheme synthase CysG [Steroidobacteraceae bacterium]|jgi:uroporphyrin-III C-methyltransferase/precorrin-2 dehydrogenase/sirohydrochlorin ferrochelatase|nr:siroheme synthase CysG [Steroidobacteraceae bacterium]